jgi:hypothetical protein
MAGLSRFVANDFRAPRYVDVLLLSTMAAWMLVLARRLRESARQTDVVLPLAILNVAQVESLMIGFAMNLVLTSLLTVALIVVACRAHSRDVRPTLLSFGLILVLLPLTGGGLAMLPPLVVWLAVYVAWGWWSDTRPGLAIRAIGLGAITACSVIVAFYLGAFSRPAYHPLPSSTWSVASSALIYLSLAVYPHLSSYWWPAGVILAALVTATLLLLAITSVRSPGERPRALALAAIILSMISIAVTVGFSRSGFGPASILASRYVTLTISLLCALYVAWLAHGHGRGRAGVHIALLLLIVATLPDTFRFSRKYGWDVRVAEQRVERGVKDRVPTAKLMTRTCPGIYPDPTVA